MTAEDVWEQRKWLARIAAPSGSTCGAGFAVSNAVVVTCAHVLIEAGVTGPGDRVRVEFPLSAAADAGCWATVLQDGWAEEAGTRGDTALLQLEDPPADVVGVPLEARRSLRGQQFTTYGYPEGYDDGAGSEGCVGALVGREWVQLEVDSGFAVERGFSGGAIWSHDVHAVVGLVITRDSRSAGRIAFGIPVAVLAARSTSIRGLLAGAGGRTPDRDTSRPQEAEGIDIGPSPVDEQLAAELTLSVEDLDLSVRTYNCLRREGIRTVSELVSRSEQDLLQIRNFGSRSTDEVKEKLAGMGLSLKDGAPGSDPAAAAARSDEQPETGDHLPAPSGAGEPLRPRIEYPTAPQELHMTMQGVGSLLQHPAAPELRVEVSMIGSQQFPLAVEWAPRFPRILLHDSDIPRRWTVVRHGRKTLPLELRRSGPSTVVCRWLEPHQHQPRDWLPGARS